MTRSARQGKSFLHYGCTGCGVLLLLVAVVAGGLAALGWMQSRGAKPERRQVTPEFAAAPAPAAPAPAPAGEPSSGAVVPVPSVPATAGKVVLDVEGTDFTIRAGAEGEPLHADASYDTTSYTLEQTEERAADGSWIWTFRFRRTGGMFMTLLKGMFGAAKPKVEVVLPRDVPIALDARLAQGGLQAKLGGLWLTEVDLDGSMGGMAIEFSEPGPVPAERFSARGSMGGWAIEGIGNLSPREFEFDSSMGGAALDFRGAWRGDAAIRIANRRGGMALVVPAGLPATGLDALKGGGAGPTAPTPDAEIPLPTLAFTVTGDVEDVEVGRK